MEMTRIGSTADGTPVEEYTLRSPSGASVKVMTFGATITQWNVPDAQGKASNVALGFEHLRDYEKTGPYLGAICGRVANRIAGATFTLDGKSYLLSANQGANHLHGGIRGYDKRVWTAEPAGGGGIADAPALRLSLVDPDGSEGYPGTVTAAVTYTLTNGTLRIDYLVTTDRPTPINLTNHTYFNLKDAGKSDILGHIVQINADAFTPVDQNIFPTGEIKPVKGTPYDFTTPKAIGRDIGGTTRGYDDNFVLRSQNGSLAQAAVVEELTTGRRLEVWATQPGMQLYTANFLDGTLTGHGGAVYRKHHALCLETQHFPDAVHHPSFPSTILRPGQTYRHVTEFRFSTLLPV